MKTLLRRSTLATACGVLALCLTACSSPEDKVAGFNRRAEAFLQKGDIVKARIEYQNALQIDAKSVPALLGMAEIAERAREWPKSYALVSRAAELDAKNVPARIKLGKLTLASGQLDKALELSDATVALKPEDPAVLAFRAAVFLKLQDVKAAINLANRALEKDSNNVDANVVLASERLLAGDATSAIKYLDRVLQNDERNVGVQLIKVQALAKVADLDSAEQVLRRLTSLFPEEAAYRSMLVKFYLTHGMKGKAEAEQRAILAAKPDSVDAKLELVRFIAGVRGLQAAAQELESMTAAQPKDLDLKLALAQLRMDQKRPDDATATWKAVVAAGADSPAAIRARGALALQRLTAGDKTGAKTLVDEILTRDARNEQGLLLRASIAMDDRRLEDAVTDLRTILRDVPDSARAHLMLGRAHELQGLPELAQSQFARAAQISQYAPTYGMPYAEFLVKAGRIRQAEAVLRDVLRTSPGHTAAQRQLAQAYLRLGDLAAAQELADSLAKQDKTSVTATQIRGAVQAAKRDFASSIASFRSAYDKAPNEVQPLVALVRSYLIAGKTREAASFMQSVVASSPQNLSAHLLLGQVLMQAGDRPGATKAFQKVVEIDPRNVPGYQGLAGAAMAQDNPDAALATLEAGLQQVPNDYGLQLTRAYVFEVVKRYEDAIAIYEKLLTERPNAPVVANNLASLLTDHRSDEKSHKRAYELAQRFRGSEVPFFKDTLAWASHRVGKVKEAGDLLKTVAEEMPDIAAVQYHRGINLLAQNDKEAARKSLQKAIDLSKQSPFAQSDEARRILQGL